MLLFKSLFLPSLSPFLCTSFTLALLINQAIAIRVPALSAGASGARSRDSGVPSQHVPSGVGSVAECLAPVLTVRLADGTAAGSPIPDPHTEPRHEGAGGSQLAVGAEFPSTSPAL